MAKIPSQNRRFGQTNNSDLFGNIYYSKNINLDEEGYIKLSPRAISLVSEEDSAAFDIPTAFGRAASGVFNVVTTNEPWETQISASSVALTHATDDGTSVPNTDFDSHGKYWQNRWYVSTDGTNGLFYRASNGNWTDASVSLITSVRHPLEIFRTSANQTLCIGDGNAVIQINTSHSTSGIAQLTLPADFEVTGLSYNSDRIGVITKLADGISGQNGEAFFFVWDGIDTSANQAYGTGTDFIVAIAPYKSSWVLLTRTGNLLFFNGGGFDTLVSLPVYYTPRVWGDSRNPEAFGDIMVVDGDIVYINVNNGTQAYGRRNEVYLPNAPGGILCYDPLVGLYHRWSPSISPSNLVSVLTGGVNTSTDVLTANSGTLHATGTPIKAVQGVPVGGLKTGTVYYMIKVTSSTFKLAETREKALNGVAVDLTAASADTTTYLHINFRDYGQSRIQRTGAIGLTDIPDEMIDTVVFGGELPDNNSTTNYAHMNFVCTEFVNIGYFVTPKIVSEEVLDVYQKGFVKFRPLGEGESITVKHKTADARGLPVTTPHDGIHCTWADDKTFFTTADLSEVVTHMALEGAECEVEVISGAGGGNLSQIASITFDSSNSTYSVVLEDEIEGVTASDICDVLIENWKLSKVITKEDHTDYAEFSTDEKGTWAKFKFIMKGSDITIQEVQIINSTYKAST